MNESSYPNASTMNRHLSSLKVISRLLGHELHTQTGGKSINLSREEVMEIQTSLDLYIEEATKFGGGMPNPNSGAALNTSGGLAVNRAHTTPLGDTHLVPTRN